MPPSAAAPKQPRLLISKVKQTLGLDQMGYNTVRAVIKAYVLTRHLYGPSYDGWGEMLEEVVKRHPQSSPHLSHLRNDWDNRGESNRGRIQFAHLSFLAQDVIGKYRSFCHKNKIKYPPVKNGDHRKYASTVVGVQPLTVRDAVVMPSNTARSTPVASPPSPPITLTRLVVVDPDMCSRTSPMVAAAWDWFDASTRRHIVGVRGRTIAGFIAEVSPYIPVGRRVREIYGSLVKSGANVTPGWEDLVCIDQDRMIGAFYNTVNYQPPSVMVVLHRAEPRNGSPAPEVRFYDDDDYEQQPRDSEIPEVVSDSDDDRIPRKFVPPQRPKGYIRRLEKTSRAINRHIEMSRRLQESAKRFNCEKVLLFPHEPLWRSSMTELGHRTMKRKYVELHRDRYLFESFYYKRLRAKDPIPGVHVTDDGSEKIGGDWEDERQRLMEEHADFSESGTVAPSDDGGDGIEDSTLPQRGEDDNGADDIGGGSPPPRRPDYYDTESSDALSSISSH